MAWTKSRTPRNDKHTTYLTMFRDGKRYAMLSLDHGINNNSMYPELADNYSVQTRTIRNDDAFIQMHAVKAGSLKINTRNFKTLKAAEKYLNKWMAANP